MAEKTLQDYLNSEAAKSTNTSLKDILLGLTVPYHTGVTTGKIIGNDIIMGGTSSELRAYLRNQYGLEGETKQLNKIVKAVQTLLSQNYSAEDIETALQESGALAKGTKGWKLDEKIINAAHANKDYNDVESTLQNIQNTDRWMAKAYDTSEYDEAYKNDVIGQINRNQAELEATINSAELDSYRQLYYKQQELENTIAENRMKAIKSGTTSAQLASQQLSNIFAGYDASRDITSNVMQQRLDAQKSYNETSANAYATLYNNKATMGAQNAAALAGYYGYINQEAQKYALAAQTVKNSGGAITMEQLYNQGKQ